MKTLLLVTAALMLLNVAGFSQQQLSPQYYSTFGENGALAFSSKALPQKASYDASLFDCKDGKFYIQAGSGAKLYGRLVLPKGKTFRGYLDKVKKDNAEKMKTRKGDYVENPVLGFARRAGGSLGQGQMAFQQTRRTQVG